MTNINKYKPRYTLPYLVKTKIWPYKDSYLRGFYRIRSRKIKPKGDFKQYSRVAKNIKWTEARNFFRPNTIRIDKKIIYGKSAYGQPQSISRRYSNLFYIKQKLRFFHGKMKEEAFRNLFKTHLIRISVKTQSFFTVLESRLDRIFFRIRLLPTIFACHQFIHYNGLEVNNQVERSPRKEIKIGDLVTVPAKAWVTFYWNTYYRIYFRRWGRYIFKRRLIKKISKKLFFSFNIKAKIYWNKQGFITKVKNDTNSDYYLNKIDTLKNKVQDYVLFKTAPIDISIGTDRALVSNQTKSINVIAEIISKVKKKLKFLEHKIDQKEKDLENKANQKKKKEKEDKIEKLHQLFFKINQYAKLYFNSYFYSRNKNKKVNKYKYKNKDQLFFKNKRKSVLWILWKILKKQKRKKAIIRLKPVHFFIPAYLQIDFRTLSAIKIKSPVYKDRQYPFQISLPKTYSFYKSQGYLIILF